MGGYGIRTCELDVAEIMCVPIVTLASNRNLTPVFIKIVFPKCGYDYETKKHVLFTRSLPQILLIDSLGVVL